MGNKKDTFIQYSNIPLRNFNRNIKKAQAFLTIYTVLDNLEKGKYNQILLQFSKIGENITKPIEKQLKKQIKNDKELKIFIELEGKKLLPMVQKHEVGIKSFFESLKLAKEEILLEQAMVLTISAFEIFTKDSAIALVNRNYDTHERFESDINKKLDYSSLVLSEYDFSNSIGNILWDEQTFYKIKTICDIFSRILSIGQDKIFPNNQCKNKIYKYIELRHLIVHRNSNVDKKFIKQTGIKKKMGTKYPLTKKEVNEAIKATTEFVNHLFGLITEQRNTHGDTTMCGDSQLAKNNKKDKKSFKVDEKVRGK